MLWLFSQHIFDIGAEQFGHAPGLSEASSGFVWRIAVEDFGDLAQAGFIKVAPEGFQIGSYGSGIFLETDAGGDEGADEPAPDDALVIGTVPGGLVASVMTLIGGV